jgi:hypothetical protein
MRLYSNKISLVENERGIFSIDPVMGCASGLKLNKAGCYSDCYSAKSAKLYGYDFSTNVKRYFKSLQHFYEVINEIKRIDLPFIRMGSSGDPSEDWEHTIQICEQISKGLTTNQIDITGNLVKPIEIVIITKHWHNLTDNQLERISKMNICINTSVSAIDDLDLLNNRLTQYNRLKQYCKSILRIVSFDFNKNNQQGLEYSIIQELLFKNDKIIDTVFRSSKNNPLVKQGIINVHKTKFLGKNALISKYNKKTYFGNCKNCLEMCGAKM